MKIALALLALSLAAQAQTAKVIELSPDDAAKAKSLYEQKESIDKQIGELEKSVTVKYLANKDHRGGCTSLSSWSEPVCVSGVWGVGFEYSDDFKFIVPKIVTPLPAYNGICVGWNCNNVWPTFGAVETPVSGPVNDLVVHTY